MFVTGFVTGFVMKAAIIIPARYASSRFLGKPLAMIAGQCLVERVYRRAAQCRAADAVSWSACRRKLACR